MKIAIACLGSNVPVADEQLRMAIACLSEASCRILCESDTYSVDSAYRNKVVALTYGGSLSDLVKLTKSIELLLGRKPYMKASGIVPIDIDIVTFDDQIIRPADFDAPYFTPGFIQVKAYLA